MGVLADTPAPGRFGGLRALYINCTLNRSPEPGHSQGLVDNSAALMREREMPDPRQREQDRRARLESEATDSRSTPRKSASVTCRAMACCCGVPGYAAIFAM